MTEGKATKKQQLLLEFVDEFIREHDYSPSYREIMTALGYKSVSTVAVHVEALVAKGFLRRHDGSVRSLEVVGRTSQQVAAPAELQKELLKKMAELKAEDRVDDVAAIARTLQLLGYKTDEEENAN